MHLGDCETGRALREQRRVSRCRSRCGEDAGDGSQAGSDGGSATSVGGFFPWHEASFFLVPTGLADGLARESALRRDERRLAPMADRPPGGPPALRRAGWLGGRRFGG